MPKLYLKCLFKTSDGRIFRIDGIGKHQKEWVYQIYEVLESKHDLIISYNQSSAPFLRQVSQMETLLKERKIIVL